jgi:hypothetical protein
VTAPRHAHCRLASFIPVPLLRDPELARTLGLPVPGVK